jgi:hypothetical protein
MSEEIKKEDRTFKLYDAERFVPVVKQEEGRAVTFYGGDQAWFKTRVGRYSGCGSVAAADMFAYIAMRNPSYTRLFENDSQDISVDTFLKHMDAVIKYVSPLSVPGLDIPYGGLTSLPKFARNCEDFAASRGVALKARYISGEDATAEQAAAVIAEQLSRDNPLALLIMQNRKMRKIKYTDALGNPAESDMRFHWVAVTSMAKTPGGTTIEVSSEGGRATLDFGDVWDKSESVFGIHGIVYFELN